MKNIRVRTEKMEHTLVSSFSIYFILSIIIPDCKKIEVRFNANWKYGSDCKRAVSGTAVLFLILWNLKTMQHWEKGKTNCNIFFLKKFNRMVDVDKLWHQLKAIYRKVNLIWSFLSQSVWSRDEQHGHHQGAS